MNQPHISVFLLLVENMPPKKGFGEDHCSVRAIRSDYLFIVYMQIIRTASHLMSGGGSNHLQPLIQLLLMMFLTPEPPKVQQGIYQ